MRVLFLVLFSLAFALVESVIVVYLRLLYYPQGFSFPMTLIPADIIGIEMARESATMLLLVAVAWLAGKRFYDRLAWFLIAFGVWDIFYYVWLKVLLDWPDSLLGWDILFLIPVPWVAPVLSPLLVSVTFIAAGWRILLLDHRGYTVTIDSKGWGAGLTGIVLIFITYVQDYVQMIVAGNGCSYFSLLECEAFIRRSAAYVPEAYNWTLFAAGEFLLLAAFRYIRGAATSRSPHR